MKKLLVVALGALALASTAQAEWYVQGNLGYSKIKTSGLEDGGKISDKTFTPSVAVGYKMADWRVAVDYTDYGKAKDSYHYVEEDGYESGKVDLKARGVGIAAIYDIDLNSAITPYVGARLALNKIKITDHITEKKRDSIENTIERDTSTKLSYGALLGASYDLMPNLAADAAVEYNILGKEDGVTVKQYGVKAGLRYTF